MTEDKKVNVNKVAKSILSFGEFGLFQEEGLNLIATHWFVLSVSEEQFWKIQCKLEAKQINRWLVKSKEGLRERQGASGEEVLDLYNMLVYEDRSELLDRTLLVYRDIELFTDKEKYYGVRALHLNMIDYPPTVKHKFERQSVVVDDVHIFTLVSDESAKSEFLKDLT